MSFHPTLGRFLERDPMEYKDGMNSYEYVKSNPLRYVDPMGMESATTQPAAPTTQPSAPTTQPTPPNHGGPIGTTVTGPSGQQYVWTTNPKDPSRPVLVPVGGGVNPILVDQNRMGHKIDDVARQQIAMLQAIGKKFAQQDQDWAWSNQCDMQAANLQSALLFDKQWQDTNPKLWDIGTTRGTGSLGFGRHNVVTLTPKNGNPLPPMVLDSFHGPQKPLSDRDCACTTLKEFRDEYPLPVDADAWYVWLWKNRPKGQTPIFLPKW